MKRLARLPEVAYLLAAGIAGLLHEAVRDAILRLRRQV